MAEASGRGVAATLRAYGFSLGLIPVYLGMFHLWVAVPSYPLHVVSATVVTAALAGLMVWLARRGYFANRVDLWAHALVVLDLWLEAVLIPYHDNYGFYLCAVAFVAVLGAYRAYARRRQRAALAVIGEAV